MAGGHPRTYARSCRSPSTPEFQVTACVLQRTGAPKAILLKVPVVEKSCAPDIRTDSALFAQWLLGSLHVPGQLNYNSALPEAGKESVLNGRAWTSPCSTLISVGSVRELPQAAKVELCLLDTGAVFICGDAVFAFDV